MHCGKMAFSIHVTNFLVEKDILSRFQAIQATYEAHSLVQLLRNLSGQIEQARKRNDLRGQISLTSLREKTSQLIFEDVRVKINDMLSNIAITQTTVDEINYSRLEIKAKPKAGIEVTVTDVVSRLTASKLYTSEDLSVIILPASEN